MAYEVHQSWFPPSNGFQWEKHWAYPELDAKGWHGHCWWILINNEFIILDVYISKYSHCFAAQKKLEFFNPLEFSSRSLRWLALPKFGGLVSCHYNHWPWEASLSTASFPVSHATDPSCGPGSRTWLRPWHFAVTLMHFQPKAAIDEIHSNCILYIHNSNL